MDQEVRKSCSWPRPAALKSEKVSSLIINIDMREHFVIDPLIGKRQQLLLATQLCRMVLKVSLPLVTSSRIENLIYEPLQVNNVIIAGSDENEF